MRACLILFLIVCICLQVKAQDHCKYKAEEFEEYVFGITSEQGGLFPNAQTLYKKNLQLESNLSLSPQTQRHDSWVFTSISQLRFGINSKLEIRAGYAYIYPREIEADIGTHSQFLIGLKAKLVTVSLKNFKWNAALAGSYYIENLKSGSEVLSGGYYAFLNNSLEFYNLVNFDISLGFTHNLDRNSKLGLLSTQLLFKRSDSNWGFFTGLGGIYIESYSNIGVVLTDNYCYMLHLAVMALDNSYGVNICYTYCFKW
jgi:hypothetical protein